MRGLLVCLAGSFVAQALTFTGWSLAAIAGLSFVAGVITSNLVDVVERKERAEERAKWDRLDALLDKAIKARDAK